MVTAAAITFTILVVVAILFQLALALGAPWGDLAMGGRFPGRFPTGMRVAAIVQALILALLAYVVLIKAGLVRPDLLNLANRVIWIVVIMQVASLAMNLATPSKWERRIWGPITVVMAVSALVVAFG